MQRNLSDVQECIFQRLPKKISGSPTRMFFRENPLEKKPRRKIAEKNAIFFEPTWQLFGDRLTSDQSRTIFGSRYRRWFFHGWFFGSHHGLFRRCCWFFIFFPRYVATIFLPQAKLIMMMVFWPEIKAQISNFWGVLAFRPRLQMVKKNSKLNFR